MSGLAIYHSSTAVEGNRWPQAGVERCGRDRASKDQVGQPGWRASPVLRRFLNDRIGSVHYRRSRRIEADGGANFGIPEVRVIGGGASRSLNYAEKTICPFHRGRTSISSQHHHFGSVRNGCWSSTARQRDFRVLVRHQVVIGKAPWRNSQLSPPAVAPDRLRPAGQPEQRMLKP